MAAFAYVEPAAASCIECFCAIKACNQSTLLKSPAKANKANPEILTITVINNAGCFVYKIEYCMYIDINALRPLLADNRYNISF